MREAEEIDRSIDHIFHVIFKVPLRALDAAWNIKGRSSCD
jgi:hypothetical protein